MNQIAISIPRRSSVAVPAIVAKLDLADEDQARLHRLIERFHAGRRPIFRCLGMRQVGGVVVEAVEWLRGTASSSPRFGVVRWQADGCGLSWVLFATAKAARDAMAAA